MKNLLKVALICPIVMLAACNNGAKTETTQASATAKGACCGEGGEKAACCTMPKEGVVTTANKWCVVENDDPVNPKVASVDYKGQKIGFCCEGCTKKWAKMTDAQRDQMVAAAIAKK